MHWLLLSFGVVCISVSGTLVRLANVDGLVSAFYRILIALLALLPIRALGGRRAYGWKSKLACVVGGLSFGLELAFWNVAIMESGVTIPSFLVNISTVWVGIGAFALLKERPGPLHWVGNAVSLAGLAAIIGFDRLAALTIDTGSLYSLAASLFLAIYTLVVRKARAGMDTLSVLYYALLGSLAPLAVACLAGGRALWGFPPESWLYLACLGLFTQLGGYFSVNYALGHLSSITVSMITLVQPILSAALASALLRESVPAAKLLGGMVVLAGLGLSFIGQRGGKAGGRQAPADPGPGLRSR